MTSKRKVNPTTCPKCRGKGCVVCLYTGRVCPTCRGARVVRYRACHDCMEGQNVSPRREWSAIRRYDRAGWRGASA